MISRRFAQILVATSVALLAGCSSENKGGAAGQAGAAPDSGDSPAEVDASAESEASAAIDAAIETAPKLLATIQTGKGPIVVELDPAHAPITVDNFRKYADQSFYDGTLFHRVIKGFMIQGGLLTADMIEKDPLLDPIKNEAAASGLKNARGTIAMARTDDPDSATSSFYINTVNNTSLDPNGSSAGYCVFGKVVDGMSVVDAIESVPTHSVGIYKDVPVDDVVIESIVVEQK